MTRSIKQTNQTNKLNHKRGEQGFKPLIGSALLFHRFFICNYSLTHTTYKVNRKIEQYADNGTYINKGE